MALFTRPINSVRESQILACGSQDGRQTLLYQAVVDASETCGLILPLPIPVKSLRDDVRIIDLTKYPSLFVDLGMAFSSPPNPPKPPGAKGGESDDPDRQIPPGKFETILKLTAKELVELDDVLRPASAILEKCPEYAEYGFAVFRLPKGVHRIGPIGLNFPRRNPKELFFPTKHSVGEDAPERISVEYRLLTQSGNLPMGDGEQWKESKRPAGFYVRARQLPEAILNLENHYYQKKLTGQHANVDTRL